MTIIMSDGQPPGPVMDLAAADLAAAVRSAAGTRRRLQALAVMGHSTAELAARMDVPSGVVRRLQRGNRAKVPAAIANATALLYDQLWDVRGTSHHTVRAMAERHGWVPPLGWDDDNEAGHGIDAPAAVPADWKPRLGITRGTLQKIQSRARMQVTA